MIVDAVAGNRVSTTAGGLADNCGPLQVLQIVSELFGAGEGAFGGEHEYRLAAEPLSGHVGARPKLLRLVFFSIVEIVQVSPLFKEVTRDVGDHLRIAAAVLAQIDDEGVDATEEVHGRACGRAADIRVGE